jgi:hypothetical protein
MSHLGCITISVSVPSMNYLCFWAVVLLAAVPTTSAAQGLADVARAEQERRKAAPKATKVYTNDDLRADTRAREPIPSVPAGSPPPPAGTPAGAPAATAPGAPASAAATPAEAPAEPKRDEEYWRNRITAAREQLERNRLFAEALQSRINALSTDFVNRDDPAQRALIAEDRQTALAGLARVENEILGITKTIADIEEEARRAGVPPGWLR